MNSSTGFARLAVVPSRRDPGGVRRCLMEGKAVNNIGTPMEGGKLTGAQAGA